jgi:sialic acid synthase
MSIRIEQRSSSTTYPRLIRTIGHNYPTFIMVEVGSTHCGSLETAKRLIDVVKIAGADCVKFQKRDITALLTQKGLDREYKSPHAMAPTYGEHRRVMEFSHDEFQQLREYAVNQGLFFSASAWDKPSVDFLDEIGVPFFKIASADLTNTPLLDHLATKGKPVILSTGMGNQEDVERAFDIFHRANVPVAILQCTSSYPTPPEELHLNVLLSYRDHFPDTVLGYSGHELGTHAPIAAVAMGARVIEKHLTLNKAAKGTDHSAALNPSELGEMVTGIRFIERALGDPVKKVQPSETKCIPKLTKSVTSGCHIPQGAALGPHMLTTKSPGTGISPVLIPNICGRRAACDIPFNTTITWEMIISETTGETEDGKRDCEI